MYQEAMKKQISSIKRYKLPLLMTLSFIVGCTITINLTPIDKTCKIENTDREYNIMNNSKLKNPELIILILSAPKNQERRSTVRETWLQLIDNSPQDEHIKFKMKHYFVIGSFGLTADEILHVSSEQSRFNDMLILPMFDSYENLTEKVVRSFQWLHEQFDVGLSFKYVLKCDDDSFVRLDLLATEIRHVESQYLEKDLKQVQQDSSPFMRINVQLNKNVSGSQLALYWGYFNGNARIQSAGKWQETDWIACDKYTPYALGGGYILSKRLVSFVAKNAHDLRQFRSEDISLGLWLAPLANVLRIHDVRFDTEWSSRGCQNFYLVTHKITQIDMRKMYENIVNSNNLCKEQQVKRQYYLYNWSLPPSQCCSIKKNIQ